MKYIFDHYALLYMLEQFPHSIASELWDAFSNNCENGTIVFHRESQKILEQEAVEQSSLDWEKKHSAQFSATTLKEAILLGNLMDSHVFDFLATPKLLQRRLPEATPFILCKAKEQSRVFVYRKNTNTDFLPKIKKICDSLDVKHMEVEECLLSLKSNI